MDSRSELTTTQRTILEAEWRLAPTAVNTPQDDPVYTRLKRWFDFTVALALLVLLSPFFLIVSILIKLESEGPAFFLQERVGYNPNTARLGTFKVYKFRTMRHNCDQSVHQAHVSDLIQNNKGLTDGCSTLKMTADPRVTRIGQLLRRTSLDELPQLINVLRGEMSLVGPRPALPYEVDLYEEWHLRRLQALPGMTGWWQVMGRNRVSFEDMVSMDVYYIEHRSLAMDFQILLRTPMAVISGEGAG